MNNHLYNSYKSQRDNANEGYVDIEVKHNVTPSADSLKSNGGNWTCKKCTTQNTNSVLYCSNCGEYK